MLDYFCFATQTHALKPNALCDVIERPDASPRLVKRPLVGHLFRPLRPLHNMYYFYPLPHGMNKKSVMFLCKAANRGLIYVVFSSF